VLMGGLRVHEGFGEIRRLVKVMVVEEEWRC
jgi:hypothetical protein